MARGTIKKGFSYLSNGNTATTLGTTITPGNSYTVPADGYYMLNVRNNESNGWRNAVFYLNGSDLLSGFSSTSQLFPLAKGTVLTTRANIDTTDFGYQIISSFT